MKRPRMFWNALMFSSLLLFLMAAMLWAENALPMRWKLARCTFYLLNSKRTRCYLEFFDSPGVRLCEFSANNPSMVGPPIGGHAFLFTSIKFDPLWRATIAWEAQFGHNWNGHLLGFWWKIGPSFQ